MEALIIFILLTIEVLVMIILGFVLQNKKRIEYINRDTTEIQYLMDYMRLVDGKCKMMTEKQRDIEYLIYLLGEKYETSK